MANTTGKKYGGRKKGTPNKLTKEIKEKHLKAVEHIQGPFDKSEALEKMAFAYIKDHPFEYAKYHFIGILRMFLGTSKTCSYRTTPCRGFGLVCPSPSFLYLRILRRK